MSRIFIKYQETRRALLLAVHGLLRLPPRRRANVHDVVAADQKLAEHARRRPVARALLGGIEPHVHVPGATQGVSSHRQGKVLGTGGGGKCTQLCLGNMRERKKNKK
jgi:hypothetical protein